MVKNVMQQKVLLSYYKHKFLFNEKIIRHKMKRIQSKKNKLVMSLSLFDDKRCTLDDRICTLAYLPDEKL